MGKGDFMRIAIIGLGSIGQRHLRNLWLLGERDIEGYDTHPMTVALTFLNTATPIYQHPTAESLWASKPDVALICTPAQLHIQHANDALDAGVKVLFIEKPLSYTMDGMAELRERAEAQGVITMVGCQWRWRPGIADLWAQPGLVYVRAHVPIRLERRTELRWDVSYHFVDLAMWSGHLEYSLECSYDDPYRVRMTTAAMAMAWTDEYDANADYIAEMRHFLDCARNYTQTTNHIAQAAITLDTILREETVR